jgi:hypothetical protein
VPLPTAVIALLPELRDASITPRPDGGVPAISSRHADRPERAAERVRKLIIVGDNRLKQGGTDKFKARGRFSGR